MGLHPSLMTKEELIEALREAFGPVAAPQVPALSEPDWLLPEPAREVARDEAAIRARDAVIASGIFPGMEAQILSGDLDHIYPIHITIHALRNIHVPVAEFRRMLPTPSTETVLPYDRPAQPSAFERLCERLWLRTLRFLTSRRKMVESLKTVRRKLTQTQIRASSEQMRRFALLNTLGLSPVGYTSGRCMICHKQFGHERSAIPQAICGNCGRNRDFTNEDFEAFNRATLLESLSRRGAAPVRGKLGDDTAQLALRGRRWCDHLRSDWAKSSDDSKLIGYVTYVNDGVRSSEVVGVFDHMEDAKEAVREASNADKRIVFGGVRESQSVCSDCGSLWFSNDGLCSLCRTGHETVSIDRTAALEAELQQKMAAAVTAEEQAEVTLFRIRHQLPFRKQSEDIWDGQSAAY